MKTKIIVVMAAVLFATLVFTAQAFAQGADPNIHGFVIYIRSFKHIVNGISQMYANGEELGKLYGVNVVSLDEGKAMKVGHLYYDAAIKPYKGKAYVDPSIFFTMFDMSYEKTNGWTYTSNETCIPMFNNIMLSNGYQPEGTVTLASGVVREPVLTLRGRKFAELDLLSAAMYITPIKDIARGIIMMNGKRVDRWIPYNGKIFVCLDDVTKATGIVVR